MKNAADGSTYKKSWAERRKSLEAKAVRLSPEELVSFSSLEDGAALPLVVRPKLDGLDLGVWAKNNREYIEANLLKHGGLLFRGFGLRSQADFERFLDSIELARMQYKEGATPRTELGEKVYTSTEYPPDQSIALHNELTYVVQWPMKIFFFCVKPAEQSGETPIADVRKVLEGICPETVERFTRKGWMLVRNYGDGLSPSWQSAFRTEDKSVMEEYCRSARIDFEWKDDQRVRTRQVRPAVATHPQTGESVWFNHVAFWHISSLERGMREMFETRCSPEDFPYNTYYGDGSPIEESVIDEIRRAYAQETTVFAWREGDLLMLDNMLVAHGRRPFSGTRKILVAMGEASRRTDI